MMDINTRRLRDRIDLLERANAQQLIQIETYRRRNTALERITEQLRALVGNTIARTPHGAEIKRERQ